MSRNLEGVIGLLHDGLDPSERLCLAAYLLHASFIWAEDEKGEDYWDKAHRELLRKVKELEKKPD